MNRLTFYFSLILYIISVSSCGKHNDSTGKSDQLARVVIVDSAKPAKSVRVYEFIYDNKNRVTEIKYSSGDSVNNELQLIYRRNSTCSYNGADKTPFKTNGFGFQAGPPNVDIFHYYDNNGVLLKDSMADFSGNAGYFYFNNDYSYGNNSVIIKSTNALSSVNTPSLYYDSLAISNHNITGTFNSYYPGRTSFIGYQYTYDNNVNPISRLNISSFLINNSIEFSLTPGYSSNNVTKWESGFFANGQFTPSSVFNLSYSYNDKGLPVECKVSNAPFPYTIKYAYK
jgi:hypothetical protein